MADEQLRLLLHNYAISQDPEDAVIFANHSLRITASEIKLWILSGCLKSDFRIFSSQFAALSAAALWVLPRISPVITLLQSEMQGYEEDTDYIEEVEADIQRAKEIERELRKALENKNAETLLSLIAEYSNSTLANLRIDSSGPKRRYPLDGSGPGGGQFKACVCVYSLPLS